MKSEELDLDAVMRRFEWMELSYSWQKDYTVIKKMIDEIRMLRAEVADLTAVQITENRCHV